MGGSASTSCPEHPCQEGPQALSFPQRDNLRWAPGEDRVSGGGGNEPERNEAPGDPAKARVGVSCRRLRPLSPPPAPPPPQRCIDWNRDILKQELGLEEKDILDLPALFKIDKGGKAMAYFPNMVRLPAWLCAPAQWRNLNPAAFSHGGGGGEPCGV